MGFLELSSVQKRFGDQVAVENFSLSVEKGEFISLLGPSGCGKTTTLQMIAGFLDTSAGSIHLNGRDLTKVKPAQRGLGIVFQSYALFPHMTAAENVAFGLEMRGVAKSERITRVQEALQMVGLAGYEERHPRRMSGGQQQRVALARALVIKPELLLLDEPLSNLDAKMREEMQIELRRLQRTIGTTTILVTHDQQEAMALSDRIVVMSKGQIEQVDTPLAAYEYPATHFVAQFLGTTNSFRGEIADGLLQCGSQTRPASANAPTGSVIVNIRPEKIFFADQGLAARVVNRIFQGNSWLYQCESEQGEALVIRQNDGVPPVEEGQTVHLDWHETNMTIRYVGGQ
ncbi:ABC transporter ATP-binding protein [Brucella pseudogrignonensis]|uniref:ABC transporter ATP-binding protein n=1 Tax=Brucella pseudogrignonensis TaxID=419475 RepID=UPI0028BBBBBD|nr:ABC transporter ATP-binding protein [Brucella pseudogrignonensis]MDT6942342.1 ABC transporter ATP-binding protein [Brucella pseudogrignonensis]